MANNYRISLMQGVKKPLEFTTGEAHKPGQGDLLIKNHAVAIQPLDAKTMQGMGPIAAKLPYPAVLGTAGAGVVEALGEGVTGYEVGDRVVFDTKAYVDLENNRRFGTWQQMVVCSAKTVAKIGDLAFEQAVLIEFPLQTAVAALDSFLGMGKPGTGSKEDKVLIWGAGGAVGSHAVQYSKEVGLTVVVTASPRDSDRQKKLGASDVVDYKAPDVVDQLRKLGPYKYILTASGDPASQKALGELLAPTGGKFASMSPGLVEMPSNVQLVYSAFSLIIHREEYAEWTNWWYHTYLPEVLTKGLVEPAKFTKLEGGLKALQQGVQDVFEGKTKGKLIIDPQEE